MDIIGDAWGFSGKAPITPSRGFSIEILTEVALSWKTELNRSISAMKNRIPRWLQHYCKVCYKKGRCHERQACIIRRWYHYGDVISGQVDLYITETLISSFFIVSLLEELTSNFLNSSLTFSNTLSQTFHYPFHLSFFLYIFLTTLLF